MEIPRRPELAVEIIVILPSNSGSTDRAEETEDPPESMFNATMQGTIVFLSFPNPQTIIPNFNRLTYYQHDIILYIVLLR